MSPFLCQTCIVFCASSYAVLNMIVFYIIITFRYTLCIVHYTLSLYIHFPLVSNGKSRLILPHILIVIIYLLCVVVTISNIFYYTMVLLSFFFFLYIIIKSLIHKMKILCTWVKHCNLFPLSLILLIIIHNLLKTLLIAR